MTATLIGLGIPLGWVVLVHKRPLAATIGFVEVLVVMGVLAWHAGRRWKKVTASTGQAPDLLGAPRVLRR